MIPNLKHSLLLCNLFISLLYSENTTPMDSSSLNIENASIPNVTSNDNIEPAQEIVPEEEDTVQIIEQTENNNTLLDTTIQASKTDSTTADTISDSSSVIIDSTKKTTIDTVKSWRKNSFNIGIGWEIGKEPLFIKWNNFNENILDLYTQKFKDDTLNVRNKVVEAPPEYNVTFPMRLSFSLPKKNNFRITPIISYSAIKRDYTSRISKVTADTVDGEPVDSLVEIWNCFRKQTLRDLSIGFKVSKFISDKYFIINGVEDVTINIGGSISPLVFLKGETKLKGSGIADTSFNFKAFGLGANWEIGLSTYKTTPGGNGLEVGLSYHGGWRGQFVKDGYINGTLATNNDIGGSFKGNDNELGYITHKLLIYVDLVLSKKDRTKETTNDLNTRTKEDSQGGSEE